MKKQSNKHRFTPKPYGRGFVPISREGWVCTIVLVFLLLGSAYSHDIFGPDEPTLKDVVGYMVDLWMIVFASSRYMERHMDGELRWRWGEE